jgi:hypothetical protein
LDFGHIQQREEHWAIVDLKGKAGHTRTVPMPDWVKASVDEWLQAVNLSGGKLLPAAVSNLPTNHSKHWQARPRHLRAKTRSPPARRLHS